MKAIEKVTEQMDILSKQGIQKYLHASPSAIDINVLSEADSTNAILREKAKEGVPEGYLILANEQKMGRGRLGRSFYSPKDSGIYMSLLLRPQKYFPENAVRITTMAAVAMCEAIETVSDEKAEIKWVNDIFAGGKKVCGILTEGSFDCESGMLEYAVLGLGINVYEPEEGFPEELKTIAGALLKKRKSDVKNRLVSGFLNCFFQYYKSETPTEYVEQYRNRSFVIGREVTLQTGKTYKNALVIGIDDECRLLVQNPDGSRERYSSGEISIRF